MGGRCGPRSRELPRGRLGPARARRRPPATAGRSRSPSWPRACSLADWSSRSRRAFFYAGDSIGGAVGLQLLLDAPGRVTAAALLCTGARIGDERELARAGRPGPGVGTAVDGERARRSAGSAPASSSASPRVALRTAARAAGRRRRGLRARSARRWRRFDVPRPARRGRRAGARGGRRRGRGRRPPARCAQIADGGAARPAGRARRRRPPGAGRGARGRSPAAPRAPPAGRPRRRPHVDEVYARRHGGAPRGARRRARRPRDRRRPPTSPATSRS